MRYLKRLCLLMAAIVVAVSGCAGAPPTRDTPIQDLDAPAWVLKGSGAFSGERLVFYGVGLADSSSSASIMRNQADTRARSELAKELELYNASLTKDYQAHTAQGEKTGVPESHFEAVIKQVTAMTLSGVRIVDHWQHPGTGALYALARLDLDAFKDMADKSKELDSKAKQYIKENADKLHNELAVEEEKMRERGH